MIQFNPNILIHKDEAIEMIQTGPPEQFSSVLRQYLSSQHRAVKANIQLRSEGFPSGRGTVPLA